MKKWVGLLLISLLMTNVLLVGCSQTEATETVAAEDVPLVTSSTEGMVVAEGTAEPMRWSELRAEGGGQVVEVLVEEGDKVAEDEILMQLDSVDADLAVQRAEAALALAEAKLAQVKSGARPEEISVTEAGLEAAQAALAEAAARQNRLTGGEAQIDVIAAQASLAAAQAEQTQANNLHERTLKCFTFDMPDGSEKEICPALGRPEEQARYAWLTTESNLDAAEAQLTAAESRAESQIRDARAAVQSAAAQEKALQAQLDLQEAGSPSERIAAAEAEVAQASASLAAAEAALDKRSIRAPFDGTVAEINFETGDTAAPGELLVVVATLDQLWIRTKDLVELDVVEVAVGQEATVELDALPDQLAAGHVARIDKQAEDYRGEMAYPVFIELDENVPDLRWGMTAFIEIDVQ